MADYRDREPEPRWLVGRMTLGLHRSAGHRAGGNASCRLSRRWRVEVRWSVDARRRTNESR